jgi:hypothetical protein
VQIVKHERDVKLMKKKESMERLVGTMLVGTTLSGHAHTYMNIPISSLNKTLVR